MIQVSPNSALLWDLVHLVDPQNSALLWELLLLHKAHPLISLKISVYLLQVLPSSTLLWELCHLTLLRSLELVHLVDPPNSALLRELHLTLLRLGCSRKDHRSELLEGCQVQINRNMGNQRTQLLTPDQWDPRLMQLTLDQWAHLLHTEVPAYQPPVCPNSDPLKGL